MSPRFKTEGTSQTWGQLVLSSNELDLPGVSSNVQSCTVLVNKDSAEANLSLQQYAQVIQAAAQSRTSNTIAPIDVSSVTFAEDTAVSRQDLDLRNSYTDVYTVLGSSINSKSEIDEATLKALKVDLSITLKTDVSEPIEFNNLPVPEEFDAKFVYQFYTENEMDVAFKEDPRNDLLKFKHIKDVPFFVEISWVPTKIVENLKVTEEKPREITEMANTTFSEEKGVYSDVSLPQIDSPKSTNIFIDGVQRSSVDSSDVVKAFSSISNNNVFANTIDMVYRRRIQSGSTLSAIR